MVRYDLPPYLEVSPKNMLFSPFLTKELAWPVPPFFSRNCLYILFFRCKSFFSNITALHRDFCEIQVQTLPKAKRARELRAFAKTTANRNSSVCDTFIERFTTSRTTNLSVLHKLHNLNGGDPCLWEHLQSHQHR